MSRNEAIPAGISGLTLAGVRFSFLKPLDASAFSPAFHPFIGCEACAELPCTVTSFGPDERLRLIPDAPGEAWSFSQTGDHYDVIRRDGEGHAVWQIIAPRRFESATVRWHPSRFAERYGSFERTWGQGIGLVLLTLRLLAHRGFLLHGLAADVDGRGIVCPGISGRGKSTLARLLDAAGATVLTDERPVLRQWPMPGDVAPTPPGFRVYGSPWPSSAGFARNAWAPLKRLYFLEHGEVNRITPLEPRAAIRRLIPVTTVPWLAPAMLDPVLETLDALVTSIPCAVLAFRPDASAVDAIRRDLASPCMGAQ